MAYRLALLVASLASFANGLARAPAKNLAQIFKETVASHEDGAFAATPITKRRVAVCGAGGKAGSMVFGAVQRAAQTFDAGLAAPRALCGAARGSRALNSVLGSSFVLAFAGEDLVKLTDFRDDAKLEKNLEGCATVVAPARLRPAGAVTGTEWTWDLDCDVDESVADGDDAVFGRVARVAAKLGAHVIAVASPASAAGVEAALAAAGAAHTVLVVGEVALTKGWYLDKGVQQVISCAPGVARDPGCVQAEDLGAVVAYAATCLDPASSRVLTLSASSDGYDDQEALARAINAGLRGVAPTRP